MTLPAPRSETPQDSAHPEAHQAALAVRDSLETLTREWQSLPPDHPDHIHALFSELYLCSTRNWLARLATEEDTEFAYRVMAEFFSRYHANVHAAPGAAMPHWRPYRWLARRIGIRAPSSLHLLLISLGVRAHVRFDMGRSMRAVEAAMGIGEAANAARRARLFDTLSNDVFLAASREFIELHMARQRGWRRFTLSLYRAGLHGLAPIWLATFQRWRLHGYGTGPGRDVVQEGTHP